MPTRIQLPIVIGETVRAKIAGRGIHEDHVEEIVRSSHHPTHVRRAREGGLLMLGRDRAGRYLLLALYPSRDYPGQHVLATARELTDNERRLYVRHVRKP